MDAYTGERTERSRRGGCGYRKRMVGNDRWALRVWRTKSSSMRCERFSERIYEADFLGFSYGFRPGRGAHDALDALSVAVTRRRVNWVVDADVAGFFDTIDHDQLLSLLQRRIGDRRLLRLIQQWLAAGVVEAGKWSRGRVGTPQGAVISPLLANVYLHYVLDEWIHAWRRHAGGDVVVVRYADDFVLGFEHRQEAEACLEALKQRLSSYGLSLHEGKTRLLEFGRFAIDRRRRRGDGRPETFDFLGFTHQCVIRKGRFVVRRQSSSKRLRRTLQATCQSLRRRMHRPLAETAIWLRRVVQGWMNYHAVPGNYRRVCRFLDEVTRLWLKVLRRRSQRGRRGWPWSRMHRLVRRVLPRPRLLHPFPEVRFHLRHKAGAV